MDETTINQDFRESEASSWNRNSSSSYLGNLEDLKMDSNFAMLMSSLVIAVIWVIYITYYNSRLVGYIITKIVNRFIIGEGYFKIGSLSLNALSGKIMFRDVVYITHDYTIRVQDGYLIFRWWRAYVPKDVSEDLSHSDTRLSVMLNGFELHMYNRSELYASLERLFGVGAQMSTNNENKTEDFIAQSQQDEAGQRKQRPEAAMARTWRDLIPVIKCDISSSRLVFGNRLIPTTLSITFEESHFVYSTKPAVCTLDRFMHFTKCKAENVRVMLAPSLKYTGMLDDPPRYMGEGFVLMSTNDLELYFYMDEPGLVPEQPVLITLPNGDVVESSPPQWGVDIKCGKGTDFSYGPWADRQREHLFKFFYPQDYKPMEVSKTPKAGDKRQMQSFDVRLVMQNDATIDILFTKDKETNAVHINVGAGSYLEVTLPWITLQNGYTTKINGQLLHLEATTSLQFRDFVESETLEFCLLCHYPLVWNEHQLWEINLTGCKATVKLIFNHKWFFQDLINDWASKQMPDVIHFVPYTWRLGLTLKHCELITLVNHYNWIDCSSVGERNRLENTQIALCAHFLHLSFDLPFDEFLPETVPLNFSIQGESIDLSLFIPEFHTSRNVVKSLQKYAKVLSKDGLSTAKKTEIIPKWRNVCQTDWVDFWWVPIGAINILYVYHPCPPLGTTPQADISTPVKEEILLSPMRFPHRNRNNRNRKRSPPSDGVQKFDPMTLKADTVSVELEIGPSVLLLYGTALQNFMNFKENIFGEDQSFTDMQQNGESNTNNNNSNEMKNDESCASLPLELRDDFDHRNYRPLEVDVSIIAHDVQAHLLVNCTEKDPPCPIILIERFGFEMKKRYDQTELQLLVSPSVLLVSDNLNRASKDKHLNQGRMTLSSLQVRGHAMFSNVGQTLDQDTIEYAWLIEVQMGKLSGKLTAPQLFTLVASLETLLLLVIDSENDLNSPKNDALLSRPVQTKKNTVSSSQNVHVQQVQQAIQQLLQPRSTNVQNKNHHHHHQSSINAKKTKKVLTNNSNDDEKKGSMRSCGNNMEETTTGTTSTTNVVDNLSAHHLKYKLCRVAVDAVDFWLVESGAALQLWVSPIRLANCNLHGKQVSSGLSCIIYSMSLRQLVWQPQKYNHTNKNPNESIDWLEVGAVNFGPLVVESAISSDIKEQNLHTTQQKFLKMHDERWKKLWFLWPELNKTSGKCGCTGGCTFFGANANGTRFFKPSRKDLEDGLNVAAFRINEIGKDPGFGQSILHENMLIFRTPPYIIQEITLQDTLTRNKKYNRTNNIDEEPIKSCSPIERKVSRRFSSTSIKSHQLKEVPYSRLVETAPVVLPSKLDSDSKLHKEITKLTVQKNDIENDLQPKNSVSDSKLAVDYFNSTQNEQICNENTTTKASESHHSLGSLQKEVQRTTSMSSENHSEAFFSADEDLINSSPSNSLRNSILSAGGTLLRQDSNSVPTQRKKFSSELSIVVTDRPYKTIGGPIQHNSERLSTHRSDHEIHTPEHRSFLTQNEQQLQEKNSVQGLVTPQRIPTINKARFTQFEINNSKIIDSGSDNKDNIDKLDDSSDSYSSTSYVSAVGSQEDFTLVDLHMQVNRLIVDSPMLMSSYVTHLSQCKCSNWGIMEQNGVGTSSGMDQFSVPLFEKNEQGKLVYVGGRFVPQMETCYEGITSMKMVSKSENLSNITNKTPTSPFIHVWDQQQDDVETESGNSSFQEEELLSNQTDAGSRTIVIIKLKGDLDIMISPLLLESLQRFVDALTPTVAHLHPLTIINHLHYSCVGQVSDANILKTTENVAKLYQTTGENQIPDDTYEETIKTQLQAAIFLPKVNVTLLQVSIVEEIISFSALDNIKDLTCVSLFSVCFDNVQAKFHCDKQAREVLQRFHRPAVVQTGSKKGGGGAHTRAKILLGLHTNTNADIIQGEPVFIENCEKQQQQFVFCLNVGKAHAQLRRLRNESSLLDDAVITAIPNYKSKVLFTPAKVGPQYRGVEYYLQPSNNGTNVKEIDELGIDDKLGFIMFECGLEGVALKVVKKSQFEQLDCKLNVKNTTSEESFTNTNTNKNDNELESNETTKSSTTTPRLNEKSPLNNAQIYVSGDGQQQQQNNNKTTNEEKPIISGGDEQHNAAAIQLAKDSGNVSSCVIELKVVWFNFAAPPRTPITRKIDYTRLDWNLLSTASPAINAWMNPSNRLAIRVVHMVRTMYRRSTATIACLMAEALETQKVHMLTKSRYDKLTPLAQTLQEDPSLQLCSILQQYYLEMDSGMIENNLRESEIPQLFTLRQGVIVLSRQWKNILYTPLLPQHTVKTRIKPLNVTISVPEVDEVCMTDGEVSGNEDHDITDEHARLLYSGIILKPNTAHRTTVVGNTTSKENVTTPHMNSYIETAVHTPQVAVVSGGVESVLTSPSPTVPHRKRKKSLQPTQHPNSSRASVVLPLLTNPNALFTTKRLNDDTLCYGTLREDIQIYNVASDPSDGYSHSSPELLPSSPLHKTLTRSSEDLYSWMAKQDPGGSNTNGGIRTNSSKPTSLKGYMESKIDTFMGRDDTNVGGGGGGGGDTAGGVLPKENLLQEISIPLHDSVRLLDANQIFQPLLSGLGVMPQQLRFTTMSDSKDAGNDVTTLDALGSNFCLVGNMDTMHIDIVVSEHGKTDTKKKNKSKRLFVEVLQNESPAFVCEKVAVELEIDRMTDMAVNEMMKTKNVLYISRGQLKNHTSTVINFTIGVRFISQRVNMPLLRLLHQISNMYQNVKDTQNELREEQPTVEIRRSKTSASDHTDIKHQASISDIQDTSKQLISLKISDSSGTSKPIVSPSPSLRSRPQSFAQKLRSTGKSVRGYVNLSEGNPGYATPLTMSSPSGSALDHITVSSEDKMQGGRCWKTIYHLLDLYANMPDTKTIKHRFSVSGTYDISEHYKGNRKYDILTEMKSNEDLDKAETPPLILQNPTNPNKIIKEHTKLVVFGVARIHRTRLLATLSGLKLEAEITSLHSSLTWRKKSAPHIQLECSLTGQIGRTMIVLLEGVVPNQQTVVKVTIGKSQTLYSSVMKRGKDKNSGLLTIGAVNIDIPQHPVALHGMVTRGSKELSSTLQELRVTRTASRLSRGIVVDEEPQLQQQQMQQQQQQQSPNHPIKENLQASSMINNPIKIGGVSSGGGGGGEDEEKSLLQPLVMQFSVILQSLSITAALLPSLQATYKMDQVNSTGFTGSKAKFTIDLPHHSLSFNTILHNYNEKTEANLPSEASIALPAVHVSAEYIPDNNNTSNLPKSSNNDGVVFRQGSYLNANADIGVFEHSLTTDLLNHLVFVQKVFMKEVNEVVQKVYGGERPVPIWLEDSEEPSTSSSLNRLLFSLVIQIHRIQLTATTAGSSAVRLETGAVVFELSNRVQNVSGSTSARLFGKAQVDVNLSLGQIIRNALFEEADIEYQPVAFFNTRIGLRNAFQDEIVEGEDKEVVLITLKRPLIYIHPMAVDKAILVWLNYKNAYDYWNEKRANLNKEVLAATQQVYEKFQFGQFTSQLSAPHLGTLFLQLTVEDMGICLPLNPLPLNWNAKNIYEEGRGAVVITLENTSISACSSGSLVSKGKFSNLCLRFADDFENSLDDWKPDMTDASIMNLCVVSDGTYEVCSRTIAAKQPAENAKWFLNVQWQMEGVDIHLDTNVGKELSALGHTLTMLTGAEEQPSSCPIDYDSDDNEPIDGTSRPTASQESILPPFMFDPNLDNKSRSRLIEKEMNEQAKIINDLRSLGASHGTIEHEMKRLQELEAMAYKDFRRDMIQKLRRQSVKAQSIKGKFGLGSKSSTTTTFRSKSFMAATSPMLERKDSPDNHDNGGGNSLNSSPRSGPSRSASLRVKSKEQIGNVTASTPRVKFSDSRQTSLPSASSEISLPETQIDWTVADHMEIDGEKVMLRKKLPATSFESVENNLMDSFMIDQQQQQDLTPSSSLFAGGATSTIGNSGLSSSSLKSQEPNIDLELDVKVFINSGKCVLHTKDPVREEDIKLTRMRKDRSCSAGLLEFPPTTSSPDPARRNKDKLLGPASSSRLRNTPHGGSSVDLTIFHIPGMDVKLHYLSKVICDEPTISSPDFDRVFSRQTPKPRFDEYEETSRIDKAFKRQNTIPDLKSSSSMHGITNPNYGCSPTSSKTSLENLQFVGDDDDNDTPTPPPIDIIKQTYNQQQQQQQRRSGGGVKKASLFAWMTLQSVPEETIISPHILEFLEQTLEPIPPTKTTTSFLQQQQQQQNIGNQENAATNYGNYVYASFPVDVIVYFHMQPSTFRFSCLPVSRVECMLQLPSLDIVFSSKRAEDELFEFGDGSNINATTATPTAATAVGGLSVTGCLSDFSVYIFHPYGGGKKSAALKEAQWSPLSDSERKDSLSINVEFVKFHLSRSRMLNLKQESRAVIRFSTIVDIGSASFKYDMRRLTEILAFPKAWYRRSIVRRMFLGDLSMSAGVYTDDDETNSSILSQNTSSSSSNSNNTTKYEMRTTNRNTNEKSPHNTSHKERLKLNLQQQNNRYNKEKDLNRAFSIESTKEEEDTPSPSEFKSLTSWETLVLFAVNFKKLNVHMNMGNVMGNVSWLTKDFRSDGRLSIGSTGHKNLYIALGLGGSGLDAKGGIVGGNIEIANIDTFVHIREEPDVEPDHTVGLKLHALELRLDYMATSVLMCRVSDLNVNLRDEWKLNRNCFGSTRDSIPTRRPATIFMHGDLTWDQLQMMISKSTTADLLKMFNKLEEFFSQQFNSSKRAFSGFAGGGRPPRITQQKSREMMAVPVATTANIPVASNSDARHHRHWQKVMTQVGGLQLYTMDVPLPQFGTILGGTMELYGKNISLACFHGLNFKSKSWALFSLKEPSIMFNTEAQEIPGSEKNGQDVHVVQTLTCSLGSNTYKTHLSMATVCKVSRTVIFPPQFKTLQEWFHYAFANSQIDEVDKFPSLEREKSDGSMERSNRSSNPVSPKLADPNHNREVIFALPSLQLHLKTEHLQNALVPDINSDEKPVVECSFITEFEDHIFVTVDAEAFFFLHDLITSYVKEKERVFTTNDKRTSDFKLEKKSGSLDVDIFAKDWRNYNCKTWHLEPTVRLLSVAGKYIEPYGIDYILQKLGFSHARTTIPKWMQRGFMDPLDAILAVLTLRMVQVVRGDGNKNEIKAVCSEGGASSTSGVVSKK